MGNSRKLASKIYANARCYSLKRLVAYFHGKIPPNSILALGLSQDSYDSVSIGLISTEDILGVVPLRTICQVSPSRTSDQMLNVGIRGCRGRRFLVQNIR